MRLLFVYTEFLNQDGTKRSHRGYFDLSLNFSANKHFSYKQGTLIATSLTCPVPPDFFGKRIYNVTTLVGDNGAGKTTILHHLINLLQQFYEGSYRGSDRGLLVVEHQERAYVLEYYGQHTLDLKHVPDGFVRISLDKMGSFLSKTKLIYLANTLTPSDFEMVRKLPKEKGAQSDMPLHFRYEFLYNCSTASLIVENCQNDPVKLLDSATDVLNCFFLYEQYKQVKYVFDKQQYSILNQLREEGYPVPLPKKLFIELQRADYSSAHNAFPGFSLLYEVYSQTTDIYDKLLLELCSSCVESFLKIAYRNVKDFQYSNYEKIRNKTFKDINRGACKDIFLKVIDQIYYVYETYGMDEENNEATRWIYLMRKHCSEFISFVFDEKSHLKQYFEIQPVYDNTWEKENKSISFSIKTTGEAAEWFITFLQKYRYTCEPYYYLTFHWGLSSGEQNLLRLFSSLYYIFDCDYSNQRHGDYKVYNIEQKRKIPCHSLILCLDEADLTYHPEWQRRFLSILTAFLPKVYPGACFQDIQILLTTHSPLMLGDSPAHNVIYLSRDTEGQGTVDDNGTRQTFGENLYTLLQNSFGVKNGAIGGLVQIKIQKMTEELNQLNEELKALPEKESKISLEKLQSYKTLLQGYKKDIVSFLANGIIKAKLETEIDRYLLQLERYQSSLKNEAENPFHKWSDAQLQKEFNALEAELERRKGEKQ